MTMTGYVTHSRHPEAFWEVGEWEVISLRQPKKLLMTTRATARGSNPVRAGPISDSRLRRLDNFRQSA